MRAGGAASAPASAGGNEARTEPASSLTVATPPASASACLAISATVSSRSRHAG